MRRAYRGSAGTRTAVCALAGSLEKVNARAHGVNPWLVLVLVCLAQFMVILDATIVNVALPSIQTDLGMSDATSSGSSTPTRSSSAGSSCSAAAPAT